MSGTIEEREQQAATAGPKETARYIHDPSPRVITVLLSNKNLSEQDVLAIAGRKNVSGEILGAIAKNKKWAESYNIRFSLAKNPKTPIFVSLSLCRGLRLFDLAELSRSRYLPIAYRNKIEDIIIERIPTMALGLKTALAKMAAGNVLLKLIEDGIPEVVKLCLNNPHLVEAHLYKIINRRQTSPETIRMISGHSKWSSRSAVRQALIRNSNTPLAQCVLFFRDMKVRDLRDAFADPSAPSHVKPYIHRELWERGEEPHKVISGEKVYKIDEDYEESIEE